MWPQLFHHLKLLFSKNLVHLTASRPILTDAHVDAGTWQTSSRRNKREVDAGPLASALLFPRRRVGETPIFPNNNLQLVYMTAALMLETVTMMMIYVSRLPPHWRSHTRETTRKKCTNLFTLFLAFNACIPAICGSDRLSYGPMFHSHPQ
jgi:hypothetical protein